MANLIRRKGLLSLILASLIALGTSASKTIAELPKFLKKTNDTIIVRPLVKGTKTLQQISHQTTKNATAKSFQIVTPPLIVLSEFAGQLPKGVLNIANKTVIDGGKQMGKGLTLTDDPKIFPKEFFTHGKIAFATGKVELFKPTKFLS